MLVACENRPSGDLILFPAWRTPHDGLSAVPPGGRAAACREVRGKSGLHETRVAGNARPVGLFEGRLRESATESIPPMACSQAQARVKGCGKSAPGLRQRGPHGKPHPEQGRIGVARPCKRAGAFRIDHPGWLLELRSDPQPRRMAAPAWLVCKHTARGTEPGLQAPWHHKMARGRTSAGGLSDRGGRADRPCDGNALAFHLEPFERAASLVHFIGHQVRFHHGVGRAPVGLRIVADNA